jgi:predicted nucleic acid-binding protein
VRVYVETNFVIEVVLEQAESRACEELVGLAENGTISLAIPAFGLVEPIATLRRRQSERRQLAGDVEKAVREIGRTLSFEASAPSNELAELLVQSAQQGEERYRTFRARLTKVAHVLPLDGETIDSAEQLGAELDLERPDALILASILRDEHFGREPSCFPNRNTKDFDDPKVIELLKQRQCKLLRRFTDALAFVRALHSEG